ALDMRRVVLAPDDPDVAMTLSELGTVRRYQGHYDEAARIFEEAVRIMERKGDTEALANTLTRLSDLHSRAGDSQGAVGLARRAIAIRERLLGPDHPNVASGYLRLANVLS